MAENDARDGETWYQFGFPEPEREEYLALHAERPMEVGPADSRALLEGFDFLALVSHSFFRMGERPVVVIWRRNGAVDVVVRNADCAVDQRRTLEGAAAEKLLSAVLATHADTWAEPFVPEEPVLDGNSWSMTVYAEAGTSSAVGATPCRARWSSSCALLRMRGCRLRGMGKRSRLRALTRRVTTNDEFMWQYKQGD